MRHDEERTDRNGTADITLASRIAALRAVVGKMTPGLWEAITAQQGFIVTAKDQIYDVAVVRNIGNEDNEANACGIVALRNEALDLITALESRLSELEPDAAKERQRREHQGTHGPDCWQWGPAHYQCALERLAGAEAEAQAAYVAHAECPADNDITADQRRAWETYRPYFHARVKALDAAIRAGKETGK